VNVTRHDPPSVPAAIGGYTHAIQVTGPSRMLFISGQIPETPYGMVPSDPEEQCRQVWAHVLALLDDAGMTVECLAKVTTYLSDREHAAVNAQVRAEVLGDHRPALTVIVAEIWDPRWLVEIEAVAFA
jgi:2-iminobutanoate/2-iminopropanoate deaminase